MKIYVDADTLIIYMFVVPVVVYVVVAIVIDKIEKWKKRK